MLNWFKSRMKGVEDADRLYGALVAQAREPEFYRDFGVPDTMEGRYELVVLHLFLVMERLRGLETGASAGSSPNASPDAALARATLERFVEDMDDCMREIGVGDMTVPKKVKKAAAGFYERSGQLRMLIAQPGDAPLAAHLAAVLIGETSGSGDPRADALAHYVRRAGEILAATPIDAMRQGRLGFPPLEHAAAGGDAQAAGPRAPEDRP